MLNKLSNSSLGSTGSSNSLQQAGTAAKEFTSGSIRPRPFLPQSLSASGRLCPPMSTPLAFEGPVAPRLQRTPTTFHEWIYLVQCTYLPTRVALSVDIDGPTSQSVSQSVSQSSPPPLGLAGSASERVTTKVFWIGVNPFLVERASERARWMCCVLMRRQKRSECNAFSKLLLVVFAGCRILGEAGPFLRPSLPPTLRSLPSHRLPVAHDALWTSIDGGGRVIEAKGITAERPNSKRSLHRNEFRHREGGKEGHRMVRFVYRPFPSTRSLLHFRIRSGERTDNANTDAHSHFTNIPPGRGAS